MCGIGVPVVRYYPWHPGHPTPYLGALITNMSAILPRSNEPWLWDRPSDAAALSVAATRLSSMVMRRLTQARCIVKGWSQIKQAISQVVYRSLKAWKPYTWIVVVLYYSTGWLGSLSFFAFFWEKTVSVDWVDEWSHERVKVNIPDLPWTISPLCLSDGNLGMPTTCLAVHSPSLYRCTVWRATWIRA